MKRKMTWNAQETRAVCEMFHYAIENEIDCMNEDDIEEAIPGFTDEAQTWWYALTPGQVSDLQDQINDALEAFFGVN